MPEGFAPLPGPRRRRHEMAVRRFVPFVGADELAVDVHGVGMRARSRELRA